MPGNSRYRPFYEVVESIPEGRVATYGQVAMLAGKPGRARLVGHALSSLDEESDVPWHRVINARGEISRRGLGDGEHLQRILLESEGVVFTEGGRVNLKRFRWR
ncbi:MAG: methyltransferase [bacterium]|nr:methyltransferase [bacterium]